MSRQIPSEGNRKEPTLVELGRVSEETRVSGYPPEKRDNIAWWTKGPYVF